MHSGATPSRVRLLEVEPDLGRYLSDDEREEARSLTVPVAVLPKGERPVQARRLDKQAFGALVLEGMLLQRLHLTGQEAMRLIGPGDLIALEESRSSTFVSQSDPCAIADARVAILGSDFLAAARRRPALIAGLHLRLDERTDRVAAQLMVCQLPRVADRLLAMMWLLAESWGRVTPAGVTLPLSLTHEALGGLIGARRPTVSLALAELIERGAVVRQQGGWLLVERLADEPPTGPRGEAPVLLERCDSQWLEQPAPPAAALAGELLDTVQRLREELGRTRAATSMTLANVRSSRERIRLRRERLAAHR